MAWELGVVEGKSSTTVASGSNVLVKIWPWYGWVWWDTAGLMRLRSPDNLGKALLVDGIEDGLTLIGRSIDNEVTWMRGR